LSRRILIFTARIIRTHSHFTTGKPSARKMTSQSRISKRTLKGIVKSMAINDEKIFILCNESQLKVFSIETFELIKAIDVFAGQIKLVSDAYIASFNVNSGSLHFYDQDDLEKAKESFVAKSTDDWLQMATDCSPCVSFSNSQILKCAHLDF
jgi:hypothetical protein